MRSGIGVVFFLYWLSPFLVWAEPAEINNKGCRDCHRFFLTEKKTKEGPELFYAGDKFLNSWLKRFLQSPVVARQLIYVPDPNYPGGKPEKSQSHVVLTKDESERVSDFLATLRLPGLKVKMDKKHLSKSELAKAKILFERKYGCISCHKALNLVGKVRGGVSGPSLVDSGLRLKPDWIFHWLQTPEKFLPKGRMPIYDLNDATATYITKYILSIRTKLFKN